jgi:hypothetical protein
MIMKNFIVFILSLSMILEVKAHDSNEWCDSNDILNIGQINITESSLLLNVSNGVACSIPVSNPANFPLGSGHREIVEFIGPIIFSVIPKQHGMEDEYDIEYRTTLAYAYCTCSNLNGLNSIDPRRVRPIFITNSLTNNNHHEDFRYDDGANFTCNVCRLPFVIQ